MATTGTAENFIKKAKAVHKDSYDYERVIYINARTKVEVLCGIHGLFLISPDNHLRGRGCPKCAGKKWTKVDFISAAKEKHGNTYDYSNLEFKNKNEDVKIVCHKHGEFYQNPYVHIKGSGCPKCIGRNLTFDELVAEARKAHNNQYEYLELITKNDQSKRSRKYLKIKCIKHDHIWLADPYTHINNKTGCDLCGNERSSQKQRSSFERIRQRIESLHPNYVIPPKQSYQNQHQNIVYFCKIHGKQKGRVINLLNGQGCPICGQESRNDFFRDDWSKVIERIESKHPNITVYVDQRFENHHSPIVFNCKNHGDKVSNANTLISKGAGCNECANEKRASLQKSDWNLVVKKILEINKNITIDSNQRYINTNSHISYTCKEHGIQSATPSKLLMGRGCPKCAIALRNNYSDSAWCSLCGDRNAKLYWLKMQHGNEVWYKVGKTFQTIENRWWELKKLKISYEVLKVVQGPPEYICKLERRFHRYYKKHHYVPKISFGGSLTECLR